MSAPPALPLRFCPSPQMLLITRRVSCMKSKVTGAKDQS